MGLVLIVGALVHPLSLTRKLLEQSFNQSDQSQSVSQLVNLTRFGIVLDETWNMREESLTSNIDPVYGEEVEMFCDENVREFLKRITNDVDVQRFTLESSCTSWRWKMAEQIWSTELILLLLGEGSSGVNLNCSSLVCACLLAASAALHTAMVWCKAIVCYDRKEASGAKLWCWSVKNMTNQTWGRWFWTSFV